MIKDTRDSLWKKLEKSIQSRAEKKDKKFVLNGKWKKFVRRQSGFLIFSVDGTWIRNNLCAYFGHGGHGLVHEFIPKNEIWISTRHYHEGKQDISRCNCKVDRRNQIVTENYFDSCVIHEITEFIEMKKGTSYWVAHNIALDAERRAGLLKDPFDDRN